MPAFIPLALVVLIAQAGDPPRPVAPAGRTIEARSVRPAPAPGGQGGGVLSYGLTDRDLDRLRALPAVARAVPVRQFPKPARYLGRETDAEVVGTTAEFAALAGLEFVRGRPLKADDDARFENFAVLGPTIAAELFPDEDPVGKTIKLGTDYYTVVGVAQARPAPPVAIDADGSDALDRAVYLPFNTCRLRFGARIVRDDPRRVEEVQLSRILLDPRPGADVAALARQARDELQRAHPRGDVEVVAP